MSILLIVAVAFFVAALYLVIIGSILPAIVAAVIGLVVLAASQGALKR